MNLEFFLGFYWLQLKKITGKRNDGVKQYSFVNKSRTKKEI